MNKQNQELRAFKQVFKEDLRKIVREDDLTLDKLEILSKSALYSNSNSTAVDRYKDLLEVINFTKLADIVYLIAYDKIVSAEQIEDAANHNVDKKKLGELLIGKRHTDKYLQAYGLRDIDFSLNDLTRDLTRHRKETKQRMIAARLISDEFRRIELQINEESKNLYFTDKLGRRGCIDDFTASSFGQFLEIAMYTSKIFSYQMNLTIDSQKRLVKDLLKDARFRTSH